jgi:monomeric sarcosine oxidase
MGMQNQLDVIVIGVGVVGAAALYHLSKTGQRVLGMEQFELDHRLGSSYGESRIIRYAYQQPVYVEMAKLAFEMWGALEQEADQTLLLRTGGLDFGDTESPSLNITMQNLSQADVPFEVLTPDEVHVRFPQFQLSDNMLAVFQADAASLYASRCVMAMASLAQRNGAEIIQRTQVSRIEPLADSVRVHTSQGVYETGKVILSAGSWTNQLLEPLGFRLPLQPTREQLVFFDAPEMYTQMPVFISHADELFYGLPSVDGTGLKVAVHGIHEPTDPDHVNRVGDAAYAEKVRDFVREYLPAGAGDIREIRTCLYTMTPDEDFIYDTVPDYPRVIVGSACSGHGFKFGIVSGRLLADLATEQTPVFDVSPFRASRFASAPDA